MSDDLHAISSEDPATSASADPPAARKRPLPPGDPAHGAPTAAGLAAAAPLAGLLGRATPGAPPRTPPPAAATPTP